VRIMIAIAFGLFLAACTDHPQNMQPQVCGPGGMGCSQGPMPYGDIPGAVGGSAGSF